MKTKVHVWPVVAVIVLPLWIAAMSLLWWWMDPRPVDRLLAEPQVMNTKPVVPGSLLFVRWKYEKLRDCESHFERRLVNHQIYRLPDTGGANLPLGKHEWTGRIRIPESIAPGHYTYRVRGVYQCNPVWDKYIDYPPVEFEVR